MRGVGLGWLRQGFLGLLVGLSLPAAAALAAPPAAQDTLDQQQPTSDNIRAGISGTGSDGFQIAAQTFQVGLSGSLDRVSVFIEHGSQQFNQGAPAGTYGDVVVQLRTTAGGLPTGSILASTTIPEASIPPSQQPGWVDATFGNPANVQAGAAYAIVLARTVSGQQSQQYFNWMVSASNTYPGGSMVLGNNTFQPSGVFGGNDAAFRTYVVPAVTDPGPLPGGGGLPSDGRPGMGATPELSSLALFGNGGLGLAGYALARVRGKRRAKTDDPHG